MKPVNRIVQPAANRGVKRSAGKALIRRETHAIVLRATEDGYAHHPFFHWLGDLRRKKLHIYGGLLRFIDISVDRGVPKWVLDMIPAWISEYIAEQYERETDPSPPSAVSKAA